MHEFFPENLLNPARSRRAGLMRQFRSDQLDNTSGKYYNKNLLDLYPGTCTAVSGYSYACCYVLLVLVGS